MVSSFAVMHRHRMIAATVLVYRPPCVVSPKLLNLPFFLIQLSNRKRSKFNTFWRESSVASEASWRNSRACTKSASPHPSADIPADAIKLVMWVPGCRMAAFAVYFAKPESAQRTYSCVPLSNVSLVGRVPKKLLTARTEVELVYLADWACNFFGLNDCMIPTILLPTVHPDSRRIVPHRAPRLQFATQLHRNPLVERNGKCTFVKRMALRFFDPNPPPSGAVANGLQLRINLSGEA